MRFVINIGHFPATPLVVGLPMGPVGRYCWSMDTIDDGRRFVVGAECCAIAKLCIYRTRAFRTAVPQYCYGQVSHTPITTQDFYVFFHNRWVNTMFAHPREYVESRSALDSSLGGFS